MQQSTFESSEYMKDLIFTYSYIRSFSVASAAFSNVLKAKEDLQKSPEQLEQEKRSILAQRIPTLQLDGKTKDDLIEKV